MYWLDFINFDYRFIMNNEIQYIDIEQLEFDLENPRIPRSIKQYGDRDKILEWMLRKENITDLMVSIGEKGYFPAEPILVIPKGEKYLVIEGNRRFSATFLLSYPDRAPILKSKVRIISDDAKIYPKEIPCLVFEKREEILDYLGYRHITGVEAWDALAKARYLKLISRQYENLPFSERIRTLAKIIGSTPVYVRQLLLGLSVYENIENKDFFDISGLDDRNFEFGTFYTAIAKKNISEYIGVNQTKDDPSENINFDHLEDITRWIFEKSTEGITRVGESRNLGKLDKILDPQFSSALEAFKKGTSILEAADLTDEADSIVDKKIMQALDNVRTAWEYLPKLKSPEKLDLDKITEINQFLKFINKAIIDARSNGEMDL